MSSCKIVGFLYGLFPLGAGKDFLLRVHVDRCPSCQARLASRGETQSLLAQTGGTGQWPSLWPRVAAAIGEEAQRGAISIKEERRSGRHKWQRRAAVGVAAGLAALSSILLWRDFRQEAGAASASPARFELRYVKIEGETADAFVYQPHDSDMVIIWAGKKQAGGNS